MMFSADARSADEDAPMQLARKVLCDYSRMASENGPFDMFNEMSESGSLTYLMALMIGPGTMFTSP